MSPSLNIGALLPRRYFFYRKCGLASPINELLRKFLMRNKHATTKSGLTCCFEVGLSRVLFLIKTATFAEQLLIHEHMLCTGTMRFSNDVIMHHFAVCLY